LSDAVHDVTFDMLYASRGISFTRNLKMGRFQATFAQNIQRKVN